MPGTMLSGGERFSLVTSEVECRVERFIGSGGQGEVYEVGLNGGSSYALKCYFDESATQQQWDALVRLVEAGPPDSRFLWPIDLVRLPESRTFGYVMPKRDPRFHGLVEYLGGRVSTTFHALTTAGYALADSYLRLHSRGLCYRDISYGNAFFDPDTGDVLICDNDNVAIDGRGAEGILGTPRFMAPEIVRREAVPRTRTDLYSLAVLLFYMFMQDHPLIGARELEYETLDVWALEDLCGRKPLFIFDPADESNRPDPNYHKNPLALWPLYPPLLRDLFTRAFTAGIADPENGRIAESTWKSTMIRLRDSIAYCARCGAESFLDLYSTPGARPPDVTCWSCGTAVAAPYRVRFRRDTVLLNHDTELFPHHILGASFDFSHPVAKVDQHPSDPSVWGLRNLSEQKWVTTDLGGGLHDILPGRAVRLQEGLRIQFPQAEGELVW